MTKQFILNIAFLFATIQMQASLNPFDLEQHNNSITSLQPMQSPNVRPATITHRIGTSPLQATGKPQGSFSSYLQAAGGQDLPLSSLPEQNAATPTLQERALSSLPKQNSATPTQESRYAYDSIGRQIIAVRSNLLLSDFVN